MAIQIRRGDYADFDPSQLLDGELAAVLENDPDTEDGTGLYVGFGDDNVKRLAFADETGDVDVATITTAGIVKPDGTSITVDQDGTIHAAGGGVTYVDLMSPSESASSGKYYCYNSTTIPDFTLEKGAALVIMLIAAPANATGDVYIKINDGDLKRITLYSGLNYKWSNVPLGVPMLIVYDGNKWVMVGDVDNPSNRVFSCVSTTAAGTSPKAVDVNVPRITAGMTAILTLTNANTVPLQYLQLQVNCNMTQDYANIRKNGAVLTEADNLKANVPYVLQFDGTYWELIGMLPTSLPDVPDPSDATPQMDGTASPGTSTDYARADHVHPTDTSRASASDLTAHTSDTTAHVTAAERSAWDGKLDASLKGAANGVAELDASGKVPSSQLPSYVDDVLEYATLNDFPATGETGKIYVATSTNETYRWSGSAYVSISNPLNYATQAEAEAGTENTHVMTPLRVKQAIEANVSEYTLPPMSPTTRGGARLGSGLAMDGDVLSVALESESDGTDAGPIVELTAKGHAEQASTTGKNLLPNNATTRTANGVTFTVNADGSITVNGTATAKTDLSIIPNVTFEGGTYTISGAPTAPNAASWNLRCEDNASPNTAHVYDNGYTSNNIPTGTIPANTPQRVLIRVYQGTVCNNLVFKPMIELGSTATAYEPYTGGAPSPSPDYPQEIQTVTGHEVMGKTGRFVDLVVKQGDTTLSTTPIPLPSRGWVGSLPDGTADTLTLDGAGKVTWKLADAEAVFDGSENWASDGIAFLIFGWRAANNALRAGVGYATHSQMASTPHINETIFIGGDLNFYFPSVADSVATFKTWLQSNPVTLLYPLATPVTESRGYVDLPEIPEGASISIPELDRLNVKYHLSLPTILAGYEDRIAALEAAIAELATS